MEFQLPLHPTEIATLLDNPTHWLRSVVQFKWSVAERELYRIRILLIGKNQRDRGDIRHDIDELWKGRKTTKLRPYKKALTEVRDAYSAMKDDRNTITHGNIEFTEMTGKVHVADLQLDSDITRTNMHRPGHATMSRSGKRVAQNAAALREINQKADRLLNAIYTLWRQINPRYEFSSKLRIDNASDPSIRFENGEKEITVSGEYNLSDVLATEPVYDYVCKACGWQCIANPSQNPHCCDTAMIQFTWKECPEPECDQAAIKNGTMCWHMALAEHYENGGAPVWEMRIPNARKKLREMLKQADLYDKDDLVIKTDFSNQTKYWWV